MTAQMWLPSGSTVTLPTAPICLPPGSFAHPSITEYGFEEFCAATCCGARNEQRTSIAATDATGFQTDMGHLDDSEGVYLWPPLP
jgi:hypothetical protein